MPDLEYAFLCEHVRQDGGLAHIIAANVDTLIVDSVPAAWNLGLFLAVRARADEPEGATSAIEIALRNEAGERLIQIEGVASAGNRAADLPPSWQPRGVIAFNFGVVMPAYGLYAFEVWVDGELRRSLDVRVVPPAGVAPDAPS